MPVLDFVTEGNEKLKVGALWRILFLVVLFKACRQFPVLWLCIHVYVTNALGSLLPIPRSSPVLEEDGVEQGRPRHDHEDDVLVCSKAGARSVVCLHRSYRGGVGLS